MGLHCYPDRIVVVGGNLCGSLTGLAIRKMLPETEVHIVSDDGDFADTIILPLCDHYFPEDLRWLIEPMVVKRWPGFIVAHPDGIDRIDRQISLLVPEQLHAEVHSEFPSSWIHTGSNIIDIGSSQVRFADGRILEASTIIDLRNVGLHAVESDGECHVSERDCVLTAPHGLDLPVLRDDSLSGSSDSESFLQYIPLGDTMLRVLNVRSDQRQRQITRWQLGPDPALDSTMVGKDSVMVLRSSCPKFGARQKSAGKVPFYLGGQVIQCASAAADIADRVQASRLPISEQYFVSRD